MPFRRPVGAPIDVKELEYIAALHQTCLPVCRENATVSSIDILRFLRSRFGLEVSHEDALGIVEGLGGGLIGEDVIHRILAEIHEELEEEEQEETQIKQGKPKSLLGIRSRASEVVKRLKAKRHEKENLKKQNRQAAHAGDDQPEAYLDLVQLLSIILIPTIARAGKELEDECQDALDHNVNQENEHARENSCCRWNPIYICKKRLATRKERLASQEYESLRPKPETIIEDVLKMLLGARQNESASFSQSSISSNTTKQDFLKERYPIVSAGLVRSLLEACGERERAMDIKLINEMVEAAGGPGTPLDELAFSSALTSDLKQWEVGVEDRLSTVHFDVWNYDSLDEQKQIESRQKPVKEADTKESAAEKGLALNTNKTRKSYVPKYPPMAVNIDFTVDCHGSVGLTTIIWVFFVGTAIVYGVLFQDLEAFQLSCTDSFGCQLGNTVVTWFVIAITLSITGIVVVVPLSLGNTPIFINPRITLLCGLAAAIFTYLPFMIVVWFRDQATEPFSTVEATVNDEGYKAMQNFTFALGNVLVLTFLIQLVLKVLVRCSSRRGGADFVKRYFSSSNVRGSCRTKKAATRKINAMLRNAHSLHPQVSTSANQRKHLPSAVRGSSSTEETMSNFVLRGERYERCGGLFWTWKRILNRELFETEGVWINSRIYVIQAAQVALGIILVLLSLELTQIVAESADNARAELLEDYPSSPQWVYDLVPTGKQVYAAFYPAIGVMIIILVAIILIYLPSATRTTLQYRCGMKPSLTSKLFNTHRHNPDTVYLNISSAVYAMTGSAVLFFLLVALAVFLLVWDFSKDFMISLIAWGIGLTITIVLKMVLTTIWRKKYYSAYYRTRPFSANLSLLALEGWYIGLGGGILLGRLLQFLLAAAFWVGRIDVRFLDEDVNLIGYGFDYLPFNFEKDLLAHDGHRHPYIERLGCMYMMKLKHGSDFSTNAGACWRQLFVIALMPWMMKNRVFNDQKLADAMESFAKKKSQKKEKTGYVDDARVFGDGLVVGLKTGGMGYYPIDEEIQELADA